MAHYSYLIGDQNEAVVVDPRRDCDVYIRKAHENGMEIKHVLETHRNEDYLIGSLELAEKTDAEIWHADSQWDYEYGNATEDGQSWDIGRLKIEALHTPGHTPGSMSYLLYDHDEAPWMIFTGDALFAGDVGRVDLLGMDRAEEMANKLYESIFEKILTLDDGVVVCPAHGAGSVCGSSIAERLWTTVGLERKHNPKLQFEDREEFVENVAKKLERPPYFRKMEKLNLKGPPVLKSLPRPKPLSASEFEEEKEGAIILDTRRELGFGSAHVPDSLSIWQNGIPNFAGWFLDYGKPILIVSDGKDIEKTVRYLIRLGYDDIRGYLSDGMLSWHMAGKDSDSIETVTVQELCTILDEEKPVWILDVRSEEEVEEQEIPDAHHIHVTKLPENMNNIPKDRKVYVFCGSGLRSMIAASLLKREGWKNPVVVSGGLAGWNSSTCPIEQD